MVVDMFRDREELPQIHKTYDKTEDEAKQRANDLERNGYRIVLGINKSRYYYSKTNKPTPWIVQYTGVVK